MDKITLALGSQFLTSFAKLTKQTQTKVSQFIQKFKSDPKAASTHYESITDFKDKKLRSVRIDQAYRGILLDTGSNNSFIFLWVDHHDEAYRWAKNKQYSINPDTGIIQFVDTETLIASVESDDTEDTSISDLFSDIRDRELKRVGISELVIPYIRQIKSQEDLEDKLDKFSPETAEILAFLASGLTIEEIERELIIPEAQKKIDTDDFSGALQNAANQRSFTVITEDEELSKILEFPLDKWRVFLHPSQLDIVGKDYSGPARILGGAGTGKTVVAMHRARFLASGLLDSHSSQKVLFTTFSSNLAQNIQDNLRKICKPDELKNIEVKNLDAWAREYLLQKGFKVYICDDARRDSIWKDIYARLKPDFDSWFVQWEWKNIIQDKGISSLQEYVQVNRVGAGTPLSRKQRIQLWKVFQEYRSELDAANLMEYDDILRTATSLLKSDSNSGIYKYVIVDESQDFSENGFNLIAQIANGKDGLSPNSLFIVGDSQQRIYGRKVVLRHCGISIQGRSKILKLNYRTTEEIGAYATQILSGESFDDLDGDSVGKLPYISLIHGENPLLLESEDLQDEIEKIISYIQSIEEDGSSNKGICIVLRTNKLMEKYAGALESRGVFAKQISLDKDIKNEGLYIATMHRVKGLEFNHVILASASSKELPNKYTLHQAPSGIEKLQILRGERSLVYVALTRARKSVAISWYGERSELVG